MPLASPAEATSAAVVASVVINKIVFMMFPVLSGVNPAPIEARPVRLEYQFAQKLQLPLLCRMMDVFCRGHHGRQSTFCHSPQQVMCSIWQAACSRKGSKI